MHLKPTAGCQISTLIFGFGGTLYIYSMENYRRTAMPGLVDIRHPAVGLRCIIPPRHLSQLKNRAIPLI
jgi:hypothetical protein